MNAPRARGPDHTILSRRQVACTGSPPEQAVFARLRTIKRRGERIAPVSSQQPRLTLFSGALEGWLQANGGGQPADILNLSVFVIGIGRLMAAVHPDLTLDAQVIGGHQVVAER